MNTAIPIVIVIIITLAGTGAVMSYRASQSQVDQSTLYTEYSEPEPTLEATATATPSPARQLNTASPTTVPSSTIAPTSTNTNKPQSSDTNWQYPNSSIVSQTDSSMTLTTNDAASQVTQWYKDSIEQNGYSAKSFVTTTTNGMVNNVLSAAKTGESITVKITTNSATTIEVLFE
jgi:hypothetical protein